MIVEPYWINERVAIVPRPRGGDWLDDEMLALCAASVSVVVSMLEAAEALELGLLREDDAARKAGLQFINFPIPDRGVPADIEQFYSLLDRLAKEMRKGNAVGVHCRACIGRASILAASLLIRSGMAASEAWREVKMARGCDIPDTREQREWVDSKVEQIR